MGKCSFFSLLPPMLSWMCVYHNDSKSLHCLPFSLHLIILYPRWYTLILVLIQSASASAFLLVCTHTTWTNWLVLTKDAHYSEGGNKWPHFQGHTSTLKFQILTKKRSATYLLNQMTNSGQTSCIVTLGWFKDFVRFWWAWPNFQGHHTIKTVKISLVCTPSPEPIGGFWPNLHRNTFGTWKRND